MKIYQSRSFEQRVKKMPRPDKEVLDAEIRRIAENPRLGEEKKGDLKGIFVYNFRLRADQYLLAYRWIGPDLELLMIGPHENYYRDLKRQLKNR